MRLIMSFAWILIVFYCKSVSGNFKSNPTDKEVLQELLENPFENFKPDLEGRKKMDPPPRIRLPVNWADMPHNMEGCDGTVNVAYTYLKFLLNSEDKPCNLNFIGSISAGCTATILCHKVVTFKPPKSYGSPESCVDDYFRLADGTTGNITGCGNFIFNKMPRHARNGGRDLYLVYKGKSLNSPCIVFCKEDLNDSYKDILPPKPLARYRNFRGFPAPEDFPSCACGVRNNQQGRIVGGEVAKPFEFPWLGALVYRGDKKWERYAKCGGALISDKHVLTAAHCLDKPNVKYSMLFHAHVMNRIPNGTSKPITPEDIEGLTDWDIPNETDETEQSIRVPVESYILHPFYKNKTLAFDAALITLQHRVSFSDGRVLPICLPGMDELFKFKENDTTFTVAGWGIHKHGAMAAPRRLQKLDAIPYINDEHCERYTFPTQTHMCAGYLEGGKSTCQGDSGGPLAFKLNSTKNQYVVVGIVSGGVRCAEKNNPQVYTIVQEILQWIYSKAANTDAFWCKR